MVDGYLPVQWQVYQLLKLGVSLTEQGRTTDGEAWAVDLDWLAVIDQAVIEVTNEAM